MEVGGRQLRNQADSRLRHLLQGHVHARAPYRHLEKLHLLRPQRRCPIKNPHRLSPILRRGESRGTRPPSRGGRRQNRRVLAHAGFGQEFFDDILRPPAYSGVCRMYACGGDRPQRPRQPALRSILPLPRLPAPSAGQRREPRASATTAARPQGWRHHIHHHSKV